MTTDPLLTAFAEQLGLSVDEAQPALERVIAAMRAALDSESSVTLDGIGTFAGTGADRTFEPDPSLVAAVNGDYAGLAPVSEPVPVPFLTSFPVVPVVTPDETSAPVGASDPSVAAAPPSESAPETESTVLDAASTDDLTIELGTNDDVAGQQHEDDERDGDLAAVMAGVWAPPPSPPVAPLETPTGDFESESTVLEADDDQGALSFEEAGFSFVEAPSSADRPAVPPPVFTPVVAAPFAATASAPPTPAPVVMTSHLEAADDGGWSKLWLVLPLVALVTVGLWLLSRRNGADESAGAEIAAQPTTGATGSGEPIAAGGAPVDASTDSLLAAEAVTADVENAEASHPAPEPTPAPTASGPATPPSPDGGYRPAPITAPQPAPAREPARPGVAAAPTRNAPTRPTAARPEPTPATSTARAEAATLSPAATAPPGASGMHGTVPVDPSAGGFTWILASTDAADARERVAIYRSLGFRAAVLTAYVDGREVYRVAVGQFAGAAQARAARALLPNDAPADAWLLRLGRTP